MGSLKKAPGKNNSNRFGTSITVKKILDMWTRETFLELAPHSSAPNVISNKPPGDPIKKASVWGNFLILIKTEYEMKCDNGIYNIKKQRETNQILRSFIILGWK